MPDKVVIVVHWLEWEGEYVIGVYSSVEAALKAHPKARPENDNDAHRDNRREGDSYTEWEVQNGQ
jgi:hypothetical protein